MKKTVLIPALIIVGWYHLAAQNWSTCNEWYYTVYGNYIVRNNTWGNYQPGYVSPQCMTANSKDDWTVSANHQNGTGMVKSYPQCWTGWQKGNGWIVPPSILPVLAEPNSNSNNVLIDWSFNAPASGRYLSALDCYTHSFPNPGNGGNGSSDDASWNILIFPHYQDNTGYFQGDTMSPWLPGRYFIDGKWWYVQVNFNSNYGWCDQHMVFKAVDLTTSVSGLNLNKFIQFGRNQGWVTGTQYITSVQAGWELIEGGSGFATTAFNVAKTTALAVETTRFYAFAQNTTNVLEWAVASEKDHDFFDIERSNDGVFFETIGRVTGRGTSNTAKVYQFTDNNPFSTTYYRLRQVDNNGTATYSPVVVVASRPPVLRLMPNPATDFIRLETAGTPLADHYFIVNARGEMVQSAELPPDHRLDIQALPPGLYVVGLGQQYLSFVKK